MGRALHARGTGCAANAPVITNRRMALALEQVAALLAAGSATSSAVDAYRRAARMVGDWPAEVATLDDPGRQLGLGASLGAALRELAETGRLRRLERLRAEARRAGAAGSGARAEAERPALAALLDVDAEYRRRAAAGDLPLLAPRRFNPSGEAWLPVLCARRENWDFTALYSNTARAHRLGTTRDWVVLYYAREAVLGRCTVVTQEYGPLCGQRVVRGREMDMFRALR